ncbi:MAG TPA: flagellar hook-basal body complex protein FliE [Xanthobacteraceae bacterium]|nr:flagellar hook-basal body complex protein FliE [Xanthobacteraceae bacterium]
MATPSVAAAAYSSLSRILDSGGPASKASDAGGVSFGALVNGAIGGGAAKANEAGGAQFGALVKEAIGSVVEAGRKADSETMAMAQGKANIMDVVTAVSETDVAVSTLVSVRDRVIQSYEDIMRMPI